MQTIIKLSLSLRSIFRSLFTSRGDESLDNYHFDLSGWHQR